MSRGVHPQSGFAYWRTLVIALVVATLVTLPFWWAEENDLTGQVVFPAGDIRAGEVREVRCPFPTRGDTWVTCYRLYAPQVRGADNRLISTLAVKITPVGGASKPDPLLYLEGGPGYASVPADRSYWGRNSWVRSNYSGILGSGRAVIFVDTRGLGLAEPRLQCPKATEAAWHALKDRPNPDEPYDISDDAACFTALQEKGVNFAGYNSAEVAMDLADLRRGLGIREWNVYGISYGAQTALNLLAVDRAGVRSVIFDSPSYGRDDVFPADQAAFDRVVEQMGIRCDQKIGNVFEQSCSEMFRTDLRDLLNQLQSDPIALRGHPFSSPLYLDDRLALTVFHSELYSENGQDTMAVSMHEMESQGRGYFASLSNWSMYWRDILYWAYMDEAYSTVVHYATACREMRFDKSSPPSDWPVYLPKEEQYQRDICTLMGLTHTGRPIDAAAFTDTPALILSGDRDVITPPSYGAALAEDMGADHIILPDASHGLLFWYYDECMQEQAYAFLDDPQAVQPSDCSCKKAQIKDSPFACALPEEVE